MTGAERIGWSQAAPSRQELDTYEHAAYVDGQRVPMAKASCGAIDAQTYDCSAPLPQMSVGRHTLELVAILNGVESAHSQALVLTVGNAFQASQGDAAAAGGAGATHGGDGLAIPAPRRPQACFGSADDCYDVERVPVLLADPHALTAFPDGRIVVAEGDARMLAIGRDGASELQIEPPCRTSFVSRINSIAPDPAFVETRLVYVAWSCDNPSYPRELLVVRYREVNDTFGEAATVFRRAGVGKADALVAVTRDRRLTLAIPESDHWSVARLTMDGSVPPENPKTSPVLFERRSVTALATDANGEAVFIATGDGRVEVLGARRKVQTVPARITALGVGPGSTSMFVAADPDRSSLQRLPLLPVGEPVRSSVSPADFNCGGDIEAIAVGRDGSVAILTNQYENTGSSRPLRSIVCLHPPSALR